MSEPIPSIPETYYGFIYHYYRAEVYRETNWRNRLDVTTNWSIVTTGAILSFAFTNESAPHALILMNFVIVWFFLYIEARRFRYYSVLKERTRLIENHLLSPIINGSQIDTHSSLEWAHTLSESLTSPKVTMSRLDSIAWRFRRNYSVIFLLILTSWIAKVTFLDSETQTLSQFFISARLWFIPGEVTTWVFFLLLTLTFVLGLYIPQASKEDDLP